ncbi:hypothetical protein [Aquibacillus kalidii]|uniref:hypothetical protein n=1 Tax=Aquibacillus kalidii TaxID=2762597 RepID=UPI0016468ACA|nr:hypothetical protein [Aquibacillus kalidii]
MEDELRLSLEKIKEEGLHNLIDCLNNESEKRERFINQLALILNNNLEPDLKNPKQGT